MKRMLLITAGVLIIAAAFMIWDAAMLRDAAQTVRDSRNGTEEGTISGNTAGIIPDGAADNDPNGLPEAQEDSDIRTILKSEPIPVKENSPEYEIKLTLCQDDNQKIFLRLEYFQDGIGTVKDLDEEQLPEISLFHIMSTSSQHDVLNTSIHKQALLNPVYGQLYLLLQGRMEDEITKASFYRVDLADTSVHNISNYPARYGEMAFNRDFGMLAYSFDDPPHMSVYQEDKVLAIYDCKAGEFVVKGNRDGDGQPIGVNHIKGYLYDYEFVAWESTDIVRLKQGTRKMSDLNAEPVTAEVLYNVRKNLLMSLAGGEWTIPQDAPEEALGEQDSKDSGLPESSGNNGQGESSAVPGNSEGAMNDPDANNPGAGEATANDTDAGKPAMVLKAFYTYLQSEEEYNKAMKLLDDNFKLRMAMLRQFGVEEISKSDIDSQYNQENVSLYSNLLKAAKLDTIAKETKIDDNTVIITYYQNLGISSDSQMRQLMSAKLVLANKEYKIILIEDGVQ